MEYCISKNQELLKKIVSYKKQYEDLPEQAKSFCKNHFAAAMAIDCIYHLNIGELVGTQSQEGTKQVLEHLIQKWQSATDPSTSTSKEAIETMNSYLAMNKLHEIRKEMGETGLLTVQMICDVHRVLMDGLHEGAGNLRTTEVFTNYHDKTHYYPPPDRVEQQLYTLVDRHNIHVEHSPLDKMSEEYVSHVFKYAARLLFEFVDTHPFVDGNGRMCRLLANHAISHITPFPVGLYHTKIPGRSGRTDYIDAIVKCREDPVVGPGDLAAMLIEGAFRGWESLFYNLERRDELKPGIRVGPVVVQKSKPEKIAERVGRFFPADFDKNGVQVDKETVIKRVEGETQEAIVNASEPCQCVQRTIVIGSLTVTVDVYP